MPARVCLKLQMLGAGGAGGGAEDFAGVSQRWALCGIGGVAPPGDAGRGSRTSPGFSRPPERITQSREGGLPR